MNGKRLLGGVFVACISWSGMPNAAPATVDFIGGRVVDFGSAPFEFDSGIGTPISGLASSGVWKEDGINTFWQSYNDFLPDISTPAPLPSMFWNLSNTFAGGDPFITHHMEISPEEPGTFDLVRVHAGTTYEGVTLHAEFTPAPGAFPAAANAILPLLGPSLAMTGHKRDGSVVTAHGTTKTGRNWRRDSTGLEGDFHFFNDLNVRFSPGVLDDFTDLDSLTLKTFGYFEAGSIEELSVAYETLKALRAPEILLAGLLACGLDDCTVDGFGDFRYYLEYSGPRNDIQNVEIRKFRLVVASP